MYALLLTATASFALGTVAGVYAVTPVELSASGPEEKAVVVALSDPKSPQARELKEGLEKTLDSQVRAPATNVEVTQGDAQTEAVEAVEESVDEMVSRRLGGDPEWGAD